MSSMSKIRYEFDPTGRNPDNFIANETHTITTNRAVRVVVPLTRPYYSDTMVIIDNQNHRPLVKGVDWEPIGSCTFIMEATGKNAFDAVAITNINVGKSLTMSYQNTGGHQVFNTSNLREQIEYLLNDKRPVTWGNIMGKPDGFIPSPHGHRLGDVYGFEYVTNMLDEIRRALGMGLYPYLSDILDYIDERLKNVRINNDNTELLDLLRQHIENKNNPHETKFDISGLETKLAELEDKLKKHLQDFSNPHRVTLAQLGGVTAEWVLAELKKINIPAAVDLSDILNRLSAVENKFNQYYNRTQIDNKFGQYYNRVQIDEKFAAIVDLRNPVTGKIRNQYIPISKTVNNTIQLLEDGLYVGDQTDRKYAVNYVNAVTGVDDDSAPDAGTKEKPYKTIGFALSVGQPLAKREIHVYEGQIHYISLPDGGSFGPKTAAELRGGTVDILPYGPRVSAMQDPPMQPKYKLKTLQDLNTRIVFRGVEKWSTGNKLLRMNSLLISRNGTLRLWGMTLRNEIPSLCYDANPTEFQMSSYYGRLDYNSHGSIELHNCKIDTGGQAIDKMMPGYARKVKDYCLFLTTSVTPPQFSITFEGSIVISGNQMTWERDLKITGNNNCFDFYSKQTSRLVVDDPNNATTLQLFNRYTRKHIVGGQEAPNVYSYLGYYYTVETNINPSLNEIKESFRGRLPT